MKRIFAMILSGLFAALLLVGCGSQKLEYVVLDEALSDEEYAIGFRKEDQALRDEVQRILVEMKKDGKLAEITKAWFGKDTSCVPDSFTPADATDDSLTKVKNKGEFILGLDDSFPPMGFNDKDGNIVGYDIDLAKEVCSRMGVTLKLQPITWEAKEDELNQGNIDCIWNGLSVDPVRAEKMNLSEPYMNNRQVVVTLKSKNITKLADLKDKNAVVQKGSTAVNALDSKADIKASLKGGAAIEVANNVLAMYELKQGTSDVVIMDEVVARYYIEHLTELQEKADGAKDEK